MIPIFVARITMLNAREAINICPKGCDEPRELGQHMGVTKLCLCGTSSVSPHRIRVFDVGPVTRILAISVTCRLSSIFSFSVSQISLSKPKNTLLQQSTRSKTARTFHYASGAVPTRPREGAITRRTTTRRRNRGTNACPTSQPHCSPHPHHIHPTPTSLHLGSSLPRNV